MVRVQEDKAQARPANRSSKAWATRARAHCAVRASHCELRKGKGVSGNDVSRVDNPSSAWLLGMGGQGDKPGKAQHKKKA